MTGSLARQDYTYILQGGCVQRPPLIGIGMVEGHGKVLGEGVAGT